MIMLKQATSSIVSRTNVITDGQLTFSYQEIPEVFEKIQSHFTESGISIADCLVLECDNSVPSALVLLYLLSNKYSFLLLPKGVNTPEKLISQQSIPGLCRYKIITKDFTNNNNQADLKNPACFLHLVKNENWIGDQNPTNNADQKLYLRTSGSTGRPKIVVHSYARLERNILNCVQRLGIQSDDRIAIPVPISHMYGLGAAFLPSVLVGASIDLQNSANVLKYLQREKEFYPNTAFMTPIFCESLLKVRKSSRVYKLTVVAGDRLKEDTFALYQSRFGSLVKLYGSTEMGAIAAAAPDDSFEVRAKTVGKPMSGVQMRVVETEIEAVEGMEGVGEILCQHEWAFERYVDENGSLDSQEVKTQTDWFCTKDWGRILTDGHIEILGRCDDSVNRDGLLVLFSDVERAIETIIGINDVVVISKGESQRGKGIVAYCVLAPDTNIAEADIRAACFDILPRRAIPDIIFIVKYFPTLPNGKVDRQKLIHIDQQVNSEIKQ